MIKIMSKKRWDLLEQQFVELQCDLGTALEDNATYKNQVDLLLNERKELEKKITELRAENDKLKSNRKVRVTLDNENVTITETPKRRRIKKVVEVNNEEERNNTQR